MYKNRYYTMSLYYRKQRGSAVNNRLNHFCDDLIMHYFKHLQKIHRIYYLPLKVFTQSVSFLTYQNIDSYEDLISIIISVVLNFIIPFNVFALSRAIPFFQMKKINGEINDQNEVSINPSPIIITGAQS